MPTIFSHALVPVAARIGLGRERISGKLALLGAVLAVAPDLDVAGFRFGLGYASEWGHRGASHSLMFAALVVAGIALVWRPARAIGPALFLFAAMASHALLDMATDGGKGVALFWPFDQTRHFFAWRPIRVSPIGARFVSARGLETVWSELMLVWLPVLGAALAGRLWRCRGKARR